MSQGGEPPLSDDGIGSGRLWRLIAWRRPAGTPHDRVRVQKNDTALTFRMPRWTGWRSRYETPMVVEPQPNRPTFKAPSNLSQLFTDRFADRFLFGAAFRKIEIRLKGIE
jgi:hypothetical protein